ncbi:recombinase family protein [Methylobacterium sp. WL19]|uniref:recombinase family protein n=1 Tax=Methylobacterium sp. WL19 TaxID=2603896 RepID=UPI0011CC0598|nr:recombinase family protein [Methylobacterium sp. WL19]TXN27399.1 recombinase family protein [Methylobacterium sp. WL19]
MTTVLYARVSTADQTAAHQRTQAEQAGFTIDHVVTDEGVSGVTTKLADRPQGRRLFDMLRAGDVLVVRWIDRLGRNYNDVRETVAEFMKRGITVKTVINGMVFDGSTTDPMQQAVRDAMLSFMAAMGQAQAEATKLAQTAGIAHAKAQADQTAYRGRKPSFTRDQLTTVRDMNGSDASVSAIAKATGLTRQTVYRILEDEAEAEAVLARWS